MVNRVCIIEHFIIPSLKRKTFGKLLQWENEESGIFRLRWSHKSGSKWNKRKFEVFTAWDVVKGRTNEDEGNYYTSSKGRFRSALNRLKAKVVFIKSKEKSKYRRYQLKNYKKSEEYNFEHQQQIIQIDEQDQLSPLSVCSQSSTFSSESGHSSVEHEQNGADENFYNTSFSYSEESNREELFSSSYQSNFSQNDLYILHSDDIFPDEFSQCFEKVNVNEVSEIQGMFKRANQYLTSARIVSPWPAGTMPLPCLTGAGIAYFLLAPLQFYHNTAKSRDVLVVQQDGAPPHWRLHVRCFLDIQFPDCWIGCGGPIPWPPRSPDITPLDCFFWEFVEDKVYTGVKIRDLQHLRVCIQDAVAAVRPEMLERIKQEMEYRLDVLRSTKGAHVEVH
ncbi:uncharacterized protein [Centruroides vittatus]|uniref:uncharacterized protein n=1 Tax=Centruroides vittatus TaxID=120091 RepID=UPI003510439E